MVVLPSQSNAEKFPNLDLDRQTMLQNSDAELFIKIIHEHDQPWLEPKKNRERPTIFVEKAKRRDSACRLLIRDYA